MKIKYYLFIAVMIAGCRNDQYLLYNGTAIIQFGPPSSFIYESSYDLADTLKRYTFVYEPEEVRQDTVFFDIYAHGEIGSSDRPFVLRQVQVNNAANAVPGKHYKAFDDPAVSGNYVVKAGAVHTRVPVVLLRDAALKSGEVVLQFDVVANEWFSTGELSKIWRRVEIGDMLTQPASWSSNLSTLYLGKYSRVKHAFMIEQTGERWDEEFVSVLNTGLNADAQYWQSRVKKALAIYNQSHPGEPLTDEYGEVVVFP